MLILSMSLETGPRACRQGSHRGLGDPDRGTQIGPICIPEGSFLAAPQGAGEEQRGTQIKPQSVYATASPYTMCGRPSAAAQRGGDPLFVYIVHGEAVAYTN